MRMRMTARRKIPRARRPEEAEEDSGQAVAEEEEDGGQVEEAADDDRRGRWWIEDLAIVCTRYLPRCYAREILGCQAL